jgi:hypothetical protein
LTETAPTPTLRRLELTLLLPLLLVLAQQGAALHELSHLYYSGTAAAGAQLHDSRLLTDRSACTVCLSFAQVATPAAASLATLQAVPAARQPSPEPRYDFPAVAPPTPRSRGPPTA